jgi:hypothetical protein
MYITSRSREVDGPWKKSPQEAVDAFHAMLVKREWIDKVVYSSFIAEECEPLTAPCKDSKGHSYKTCERVDCFDLLQKAGVKVFS